MVKALLINLLTTLLHALTNGTQLERREGALSVRGLIEASDYHVRITDTNPRNLAWLDIGGPSVGKDYREIMTLGTLTFSFNLQCGPDRANDPRLIIGYIHQGDLYIFVSRHRKDPLSGAPKVLHGQGMFRVAK